MSEPAAAATSGPNSRSHGRPPVSLSDSPSRSAAATGVPNIAPMVPANASPPQALPGTIGSSRRPMRDGQARR